MNEDVFPHPRRTEPAEPTTSAPPRRSAELPAWPPRVFLVESDQARRIHLVRWLRKGGWVVLPVLEIESALRLLRLSGGSGRPDLVVVEKGLGAMGVESLVRLMREIPGLAGVAVLTYHGSDASQVDDLILRLQVWMECLRQARLEYSTSRARL